MTPRFKAALRWTGRLVSVLALAFVAREVWLRWDGVAAWRPGIADIALIAGLAGLYGAALFLLAWVWGRIVTSLHGAPLPGAVLIRSYTDSQIAKYLPGNVFHFVGRHLILRKAGVRDAVLGQAVALELGVMLMSAGAVVLAATAMAPWPEASAVGRTLNAMALPGLVALAAALVLAVIPAGPRPALRRSLVLSGLAATGFFTVMGLAAAILLVRLTPLPLSAGAGGAVAAWIAGFVTPGAPGGLGPREAAFVALFAGRITAEAALLGMALFRLVTTLGDIVCFGLGRALFRTRPA